MQERENEAQDTEEALDRKRLEEEERRKQSHDMVAESIKRELAESAYLRMLTTLVLICYIRGEGEGDTGY